MVGHYTDAGTVPLNPHVDITRKHGEILGCWGTEVRHSYRAMTLVSEHFRTYPWDRCISRIYPLPEAEKALLDVERLQVIKAVIAPGA